MIEGRSTCGLGSRVALCVRRLELCVLNLSERFALVNPNNSCLPRAASEKLRVRTSWHGLLLVGNTIEDVGRGTSPPLRMNSDLISKVPPHDTDKMWVCMHNAHIIFHVTNIHLVPKRMDTSPYMLMCVYLSVISTNPVPNMYFGDMENSYIKQETRGI